MNATLTYLRTVFGTTEGVAHVAIGAGPHLADNGKLLHKSWTETQYVWPAEAERMARALTQAAAAGDDAYVCPYLMHGSKRAKGAAVAHRLAHADVDNGRADAEKVGALGGFAVASGSPGNAHCYVALSVPVSAEHHELLCRGLGAHLGAVDAKVSDNDVLRPPGTFNHKADPPTPVEWLVEPTGHVWEPAALAEALGVDLTRPRATRPAVGAVSIDPGTLPVKVLDALAEVTGDRSADTMRVVRACVDARLSLAQTRGVVALRSDLAGRLAERTDDDVWTCWAKVTDDRADRATQRATEAEWLADLVPIGEQHGHNGLLNVDGAKLAPPPDDATEDDNGPGASWRAVDLSATVAGLVAGTLTRHKPTVGVLGDGRALFYRGKVNGIAGASGSGKTWTALAASAQQLDAGAHVVYVDLEDDATGVVGRLLDLGADPDLILARFHYVSPQERFGQAAAMHLADALIHRPTLVVIDSTGESMALDGAKPNDDDDTARWFRSLPTPVARTGAAVIVLDHVVKADEGGLWPIGSQRKRAAINGAQYMQSTVRAFAKDTAGMAKLVCAKDRHGNYRTGQRVADLHVNPHPEGVALDLRAHDDTAPSTARVWRPTGLMERIATALAGSTEPLSFRGIDGAVTGKAEHIRTALGVLVAEGYVTVTNGPRNATLHTLAKPYVQREDPASDLYRPDGTHSPRLDRVSVSVSLERDTGHTHSTVSGTHSGHTRDTVHSQAEITPSCATCGRAMGRADAAEGVCIQCRRIAAANDRARAS